MTDPEEKKPNMAEEQLKKIEDLLYEYDSDMWDRRLNEAFKRMEEREELRKSGKCIHRLVYAGSEYGYICKECGQQFKQYGTLL